MCDSTVNYLNGTAVFNYSVRRVKCSYTKSLSAILCNGLYEEKENHSL